MKPNRNEHVAAQGALILFSFSTMTVVRTILARDARQAAGEITNRKSRRSRRSRATTLREANTLAAKRVTLAVKFHETHLCTLLDAGVRSDRVTSALRSPRSSNDSIEEPGDGLSKRRRGALQRSDDEEDSPGPRDTTSVSPLRDSSGSREPRAAATHHRSMENHGERRRHKGSSSATH